MNRYLQAFETHKQDALKAWHLFFDFCAGNPPPRVPGMDTVIRLAWRIECGRSIEGAATAEYLYRWRLAIKPFDQCEHHADSIFGTPHPIGL